MDQHRPTDEELAQRIARDDWAPQVSSPDLAMITSLVTQQQRRRRTSYAAGAGLAAAAVIAAVVTLQPTPSDDRGADVPVATQSSSAPVTTTPSSTGPTVRSCTTSGSLLFTSGFFRGTDRRPTQTAAFGNIGGRPCVVDRIPSVSIDTRTGFRTPVDMSPAGEGPWVLRPDHALFITVQAPAPESCMQGSALSTKFTFEQSGGSYTFNFPGMRVIHCAPPVLSNLRIAPAPST